METNHPAGHVEQIPAASADKNRGVELSVRCDVGLPAEGRGCCGSSRRTERASSEPVETESTSANGSGPGSSSTAKPMVSCGLQLKPASPRSTGSENGLGRFQEDVVVTIDGLDPVVDLLPSGGRQDRFSTAIPARHHLSAGCRSYPATSRRLRFPRRSPCRCRQCSSGSILTTSSSMLLQLYPEARALVCGTPSSRSASAPPMDPIRTRFPVHDAIPFRRALAHSSRAGGVARYAPVRASWATKFGRSRRLAQGDFWDSVPPPGQP